MSLLSDIVRIQTALTNNVFDGTSHQLADHLGMTHSQLWAAMHAIRSTQFVEANGWTVPNQPKALAPKFWTISHSRDISHQHDGVAVRVPEVLETLSRALSQVTLGTSYSRVGSPAWQYYNTIQVTLTALVALGNSIHAAVPAGV